MLTIYHYCCQILVLGGFRFKVWISLKNYFPLNYQLFIASLLVLASFWLLLNWSFHWLVYNAEGIVAEHEIYWFILGFGSLNLRVGFPLWYLLCLVCDVVGGKGHSRPIVLHSSQLWCLDNLTFHRATWHLHSASYFILSSGGSGSRFFNISHQTRRHLHPLGIGHGSQYPTLTNKGLCSIVYHWNID